MDVISPINSVEVFKAIKEIEEIFLEEIGNNAEVKELYDKLFAPLFKTLQNTIFKIPIVYSQGPLKDCGYWEPVRGSALLFKCSICKETSMAGKTPFCPHCGHPMEEKSDVLARLQ